MASYMFSWRKRSQVPSSSSANGPSASPEAPPVPVAPTIPNNILEFRTITTILSKIQQEMPFKLLGSIHDVPENHRHQLGIIDALSVVAVTDYQVIAAVSKGSIGDEPIQPSVLICIANAFEQAALYLWTIFVTQNPRKSDNNKPKITTASIPEIITVAPQENHGDDLHPNAPLHQYLSPCWDKPTLKSHLWAIGKLLTFEPVDLEVSTRQKFHERFLVYIIAACHRKIYRRMKHATLSKPYLDSLTGIKNLTFKADHFVQYATLPTQSAELESDKSFLVSLHTALRGKESGLASIRSKVPLLSALARDINHRHPSELYNEKTCKEFHMILQAILSGIRKLKTIREGGNWDYMT